MRAAQQLTAMTPRSPINTSANDRNSRMPD
jgi:hypothetical protein